MSTRKLRCVHWQCTGIYDGTYNETNIDTLLGNISKAAGNVFYDDIARVQKQLSFIVSPLGSEGAKTDINHQEEEVDTNFPKSAAVATVSTVRAEYSSRELAVIGQLADGLVLARTFYNSGDGVEFLVINTLDPVDSVVFQFKWSLRFYWSQFGYGNPGGCIRPCPRSLTYCTTTSQSGHHALIVGPAEQSYGPTIGESVPTAKIMHISEDGISIEDMRNDLQVPLPNIVRYGNTSNSHWWPLRAQFDPRPGMEHLAAVILSSTGDFAYHPGHHRREFGVLCLYDTNNNTLINSVPLCMVSAFLEFISGGQQLLTISGEEPHQCGLGTVWVFDTANLTPLNTYKMHKLTPDNGLSVVVPNYPTGHKILQSADWTNVFLLCWTQASKPPTPCSKVQVMLWGLTLPSTAMPLWSLQRICKNVVLSAVFPSDEIDKLPLPGKLLIYLKETEQF